MNFFNLAYVVAMLVAFLDVATCQAETEPSPPGEAIPLEATAADGAAPAAETAETREVTIAAKATDAASDGVIVLRGARQSGKGFVPALRPACPHLRSPRPRDGYGRPGATSPCLAARSPR